MGRSRRFPVDNHLTQESGTCVSLSFASQTVSCFKNASCVLWLRCHAKPDSASLLIFKGASRFGLKWAAHPPPADSAFKPHRSVCGGPSNVTYNFETAYNYFSTMMLSANRLESLISFTQRAHQGYYFIIIKYQIVTARSEWMFDAVLPVSAGHFRVSF